MTVHSGVCALVAAVALGACGDAGPSDDEIRSRVLGALRQNGVETNDAACIAEEVDASGHLDEIRDVMVNDADDLPEDEDLDAAFNALVTAAETCGVPLERVTP